MHPSLHRGLAGTALGMGALALLVGDGPHRTSMPSVTPPGFAWIDGYRASRVDAVTVAEWLRARRSNLSILDVRAENAYADFHLPQARHTPLAELGGVTADSAATVVVYGDGPLDARRAWVVLRAFGHPDVRAMENGLREWLVDIVNPRLPRPTTPAEEIEFDRRADLARYFGGVPRLGEPPDSSEATEDALKRTRRRGCAF